MREIKFRAWDAKRNVMFDVQTGFLPKGVTAKRNFFIGFNSTGLEVSEFEGKGYWRRFPVMQYTGLKDKNGVEIYEGDIIHYKTHNGFGWADYDQISEVYWNFGGFGIRGSRGLQGWISYHKCLQLITENNIKMQLKSSATSTSIQTCSREQKQSNT